MNSLSDAEIWHSIYATCCKMQQFTSEGVITPTEIHLFRLGRTLDLGSSVLWTWGFESPLSHSTHAEIVRNAVYACRLISVKL